MRNLTIDPITEGVRFENIQNLDNQNFHEVNGAAIQLSSLGPGTSPMRSVMWAVHNYQSLVMENQEPPRILSGMEREYADSTFKVQAPCNARIVSRTPKFLSTMTNRVNVEEQPKETILYIDHDKLLDGGGATLSALHVNRVHKDHQTYGWLYNREHGEDIREDDIIRKGTVFASSPRVDDNGNYGYGLNLKTAIMSINEITEDGYVISRSAAKRMKTKVYVNISFSYGRFHNGDIWVPCNTYGKKGSNSDYRIVPAIGEEVRDDNLLFAARLHDPRTSGLDMTFNKLSEVDITHDKKFYVPCGYKNAKVVDMTISKAGDDYLNPIFTKQVDRYYKAQVAGYRQIFETYKEQKKKYPGLTLSPSFSTDVVEYMKELKEGFVRKVTPSRKKAPQAEWTVDVLLECELDMSISCKVSGHFGNKGVIVDIWEDDRMPVDKYGVRAEFIADGDSSAKRMNWTVLLYQYICAQLDQAVRKISAMNNVEDQFDYLLGLFKAISPLYHQRLVDLYSRKAFKLEDFIDEFIRFPDIYIPPYCPVLGIDSVDRAEEYSPLEYGKVYYKLLNGEEIETEESIIIADLYMMFLEKNGTEWLSVSSPRRQHFGLIAKSSSSNKHSMPWRENSMRFFGEPEVKAITANCGHNMIGRTVNRPNDPAATQELHRSILNAKSPSNIHEAVDYTQFRTNGSRANLFVKHMFYCDGRELRREIVDGQE